MSDPDATWHATRPGEVEGPLPAATDAGLVFIGRIRTPFARRADCPRRGDAAAGPICRLEIAAPWQPALMGIEAGQHLEVLYWMHLARRDLLVQAPRGRPPAGTFALRAPNRPNPIATSLVSVVGVEAGVVLVRGLDCVDLTPLLDVKPGFADG